MKKKEYHKILESNIFNIQEYKNENIPKPKVDVNNKLNELKSQISYLNKKKITDKKRKFKIFEEKKQFIKKIDFNQLLNTENNGKFYEDNYLENKHNNILNKKNNLEVKKDETSIIKNNESKSIEQEFDKWDISKSENTKKKFNSFFSNSNINLNKSNNEEKENNKVTYIILVIIIILLFANLIFN